VLPKGWADPDLAPNELAKEAFERAGLVGEIKQKLIRYYTYDERLRDGRSISCQVTVFPMWVEGGSSTGLRMGSARRAD
jgi:hypothetical protein